MSSAEDYVLQQWIVWLLLVSRGQHFIMNICRVTRLCI